ncbi:MAG: protein kinase family protein [Planctomycetota bacterium]
MKLSDPAARNPLELRCLRSLRHPGVAKYLGHGHTRKNRIWTEYEYVDGTPLSARIGKSNRHKTSTQLKKDGQIFLQLLSVVQYLHCCGWTHGDLSPQNILVSTKRNQVVLIDFEHARKIESDPGPVMRRRHSLPFASPLEIAGGVTTELCEQFALGKIGMLLLSQQSTSGTPKSTKCIESILKKATSPDPEERYSDLHSLQLEIQAKCQTG